VTLADKVNIVYFLEDRAQEGFIKALVERVAREEAIPSSSLKHNVRSARRGSRVIIEFRNFLKDARKQGSPQQDVIIVSIDGNCKGYNDRVKQLSRYLRPADWFRQKILYAVPDPHIERWYLMDQKAVRDGIGLGKAPEMPAYKCKKGHYKQVLNQALREAGIQSLLGGPEYAEKIIENISDLKLFAEKNTGLEKFIEDLRRVFREQYNPH
jgi:hypothetical protein